MLFQDSSSLPVLLLPGKKVRNDIEEGLETKMNWQKKRLSSTSSQMKWMTCNSRITVQLKMKKRKRDKMKCERRRELSVSPGLKLIWRKNSEKEMVPRRKYSKKMTGKRRGHSFYSCQNIFFLLHCLVFLTKQTETNDSRGAKKMKLKEEDRRRDLYINSKEKESYGPRTVFLIQDSFPMNWRKNYR